jgi:hypothetical protein
MRAKWPVRSSAILACSTRSSRRLSTHSGKVKQTQSPFLKVNEVRKCLLRLDVAVEDWVKGNGHGETWLGQCRGFDGQPVVE